MRPTTDPAGRTHRGTAGVLGAVGVALSLAVTACGSSGAEPPPGAQPEADEVEEDADDASVNAVRIADLGDTATALAAHPTEPLLLAARRSGAIFRIRLVEADGYLVPEVDPEPILDLAGTVTTEGERGLLDLTFSPDGDDLFASYTDPDGAVTIARFAFDTVTGEVDAADPAILARLDHPFAGHNGGDLEWLDDHTLLWALGDMDLTTTDPPSAQDPRNPLGTIVRLDADAPARVTLTGPELAATHVVATGLRNPWRMHVDDTTGTLLIGDVGGDRVEEIDQLDLSGISEDGYRPPNFGWPYYEGSQRTDHPYDGGDTFVSPVFERAHAEDVCALVAGVPVPEELSRSLASRFLVGDNCSGEIHVLDVGTEDLSVITEVDDGIVSFAEGASDEVYALGLAGGIWRLDPAGWSVDQPDVPVLPPPPEDDASTEGAVDLPPDELQAVCDARAAFAVLDQIPGSNPADYERLAFAATEAFAATVEDLPAQVDPAPLRRVIDAARTLGQQTGWDTSSTRFTQLFEHVSAADPPFQDFPEAMSTLVHLGATCS